LDHAHIKVFHSKADKKQILNTNNEIVELDGEDSVQEFGQGKKDNIYFSTFQSTNKFKDEDLVFDVIMIDEGHHLKAMSYKAVVQEYVDKYEAKN
jgi:superfamily II DNA or RNA helicase